MRHVGKQIGWNLVPGAIAGVVAAMFSSSRVSASSSADELVRQARAHEEAHEDDVAARRYMEALALDVTSSAAWFGLAELRFRLGEIGEAERVYAAALDRIPSLHRALEGRARCQWALGHHTDAETNLLAYAESVEDEGALRTLADWFALDGRSPAQLATWRHILRIARSQNDPALAAEARVIVRALVVLVDEADPAAFPADTDRTRVELAQIARAAR